VVKIETVTVDALTKEIRWTRDTGRIVREQFTGRTSDELSQAVEERLAELQDGNQDIEEGQDYRYAKVARGTVRGPRLVRNPIPSRRETGHITNVGPDQA
jgi:hypothetical protein